jgi:hypothetical protein
MDKKGQKMDEKWYSTAQNLSWITRLARLYVMLQSWFKSNPNSLNSFIQRSIDEHLLLLTKNVPEKIVLKKKKIKLRNCRQRY